MKTTANYEDGNMHIHEIFNCSGHMKLTEYRIFPGITLIYREVHMSACEDNFPRNPESFLEISHCLRGGMELSTNNHHTFFSEGNAAIAQNHTIFSEMYFPAGYYYGMSLIIQPQLVPEWLENINVNIESLFSSERECFIIQLTEKLERVFLDFYSAPENVKSGYLKVKVLELLLQLCSTQVHEQNQSCTCSQIKLACAVRECLCSDMSRRITIEKLAEKFNVSPTYLKTSFKKVYGDSIHSYVSTQKMHSAAKMLLNTERMILDIASDYGYDNGSKFAKVFKSVMGVTPREYRLRYKISDAELYLYSEKNS